METLSYKLKLRTVKLLNIILVAIPILLCWIHSYSHLDGFYNEWKTIGLVMAIFIALYITYGHIYGSFYLSMVRISEMLYSQCLSLILSDGIMFIILCLIRQGLVDIKPMIITFGVQICISVIWCVIAHIWYFKKFPAKKTIIVYDHGENIENLIGAYGLRKKFDVKAAIDVDDCICDKFHALEGMETVFLCGTHSRDRNKVIKYCVEHGITTFVLPRIGDIIMSGAKRVNLFHLPFLRVGRYEPDLEYIIVKRIFDVIMSVIALIVASPVMVVTAIAIKMTDGGPVFYKQKRLTKDGKVFDVLKFRSMRQDAEKDGVARLSTGDNDDRVTPVGKIIRKVRIDELPQLINILEGSMSIVGPRPERPEIAEQYQKELPEFALRLQAKAGLTGYAQVYGKYNTTPYNKLQMDLMYIAQPNFFEDLRIIFATIKILFLPDSTEGVAKGMETAMKKNEEKGRNNNEV